MQEVSCLVEVSAVCLVEGSVALAALVDLCQAWEVSQELLLEVSRLSGGQSMLCQSTA